MSRRAVIITGSLTLALILVAVGFTMPPDQRPTTRVTDCTTGGCHADIIRFQFLHAPVAVDACEICHVYEDLAEHRFKLIEQHDSEPICSFCHIGKTTFGRDDNWVGLHVHQPVKDGECLACHNPHGSNMRNLIAADTVGTLCSGCHDHVVNQPHMHPPVGEKECLSCHEPHAGSHKNLLHQPGRDLCLGCHVDVMPQIPVDRRTTADPHLSMVGLVSVLLPHATDAPTGQPLARSTIIHEPLLGECAECHNPHGSPYPAMLQKATQTLCISCHEDVGRKVSQADVHHGAVMDDRACLNCHSPHHSQHVSLLNDEPMALCASCHQESHQRPDGRTVQGMRVLFAGSHLHGPINHGDCSSCHDVHGGQRRSLLVANYTEDMYQTFSEENYSLCFTCHDAALATKQSATIPASKAHPSGGFVTNFRDGDLNLHYVHVTAPDESGRSCRFCHDTHAGKSQRLMRESVPYGQWQLPIRYEATDSGGSCGAGCHRERTYTRNP